MPFQPQHRYDKLAQSPLPPSENESALSSNKRPLFLGAAVIAILSSALTLVLLRIFITLPSPVPTPAKCSPSPCVPSSTAFQAPQDLPLQHCGASVEEALALGCTFDTLTASWLPSYCPRDEADEFGAAAGNGTQWRYWLDQEGTQELNGTYGLARITPQIGYWTTNREHMNHCLHLVLRLQRALERARAGDWRVDTKAASYHHTRHCLETLYNMSIPENRDKIGTHGNMGFGTC